jgi:ATP adenylyltransferase
MSICCLCSNLVSHEALSPWDRPLFETTNFAVVPSLGSLVEGWVMVVPKQHIISLGALSANLVSEMRDLKRVVSTELVQKYGEVCAFEHGPAKENQKVGCTVDHAHLHLVPLSFDLALAAIPFLPPGAPFEKASWETCRDAFQHGLDYLYLEQPLENGRISISAEFGSQVFRKAIAARLGVPEQFNWRDFPQTEIVTRTVRTLGSPGEGNATPNRSASVA